LLDLSETGVRDGIEHRLHFLGGRQHAFIRYRDPQSQTKTKPCKMADERGLYLLVQPAGSKLWRMNYRYGGKQKTLSFGAYPDVRPYSGPRIQDSKLRWYSA
jgi:hypothetical protein